MTWRSPVTKPLLAFGTAKQPGDRSTFRVTSPFGTRIDPLDPNGVKTVFHGGLDLGDFGSGSPVVAARDGTVEAIGYLKEPYSTSSTRWPSGNYGGWMCVLRHPDGSQSIYAHMIPNSSKLVKGMPVKAGTQLGLVGDSGSAQGQAHLHFGIKQAGRDVDPWPLITGAVPDTSIPEDDVTWLPYFRFTGPNTVTVRAGATLYDTPSKDRPRFTLPGNRNFASAALVEYPDNKGLYHVITNPDAPGAFFAANSDVVVRTPILMPGPIDPRLDVARDGVAKIELAANKLVEALR